MELSIWGFRVMRMQVKENYQREQNLWEGVNTELFQTTSKALSRRQIDVKIYNKETLSFV